MTEELLQAYRGKKVFITGHTGFKGSWLLETLIILGAEVKGYSLEPQNSHDLFNLIDGHAVCHSVIGDLRDRYTLKEEILNFQPDFIFHLAAQPLVRLSYEIPAETFEVNAIGTAFLLDAVRELEKKCSVVLITTDKVYHNNEWQYPYRENDRLGGYDAYSASKACSELVIDSYRNSFFSTSTYESHSKGIAVARAGNVIGGGDWSINRLLPDIAKALSGNTEIIIRNPTSVRPWQHVLEPIVAYLSLGLNLDSNPTKFSDAFNFGPYATDALSVTDMVSLAITYWGRGRSKVEVLKEGPHEAGLLKLDISKAISELNWKPKLNAQLAVRTTIDWYKAFNDGQDMKAFTDKQILNFLNV